MRNEVRDTQCAACGKYTHILSRGAVLYCDDSCRRRAGIPGRNEIKRELRLGEIVEPYHQAPSGITVGARYYLVGKPYPAHPITRCYTFEEARS